MRKVPEAKIIKQFLLQKAKIGIISHVHLFSIFVVKLLM